MIVMKNQEAVYYTEIEPEIITLKSDKRYYVQGYISTIDKDLVNDVLTIEAQKDLHSQIQGVITKGGFITGDIEHMVFYDEKGNQLNFPKVRDDKGNLIIPELKFVQSELREKGVWVKAEVNKHLPNFKTIWKSIEDGFLNGFSVAVNALETVTKRVNNEMVNYISRLKLLNITMTGTPCNQNALMAPVLKSLINGEDMKLKHKYIRREGQPGDYTYFYKEADGKETSSKNEPDEQTKKEIDKEDRQKKHKETADKIEKVASDKQKMVLYDMQSGDEYLFLHSISNAKEITKETIDEYLKMQIDPERGIMEDQDNELLNYAKDKGWVEYNKEDDRYYLTSDKESTEKESKFNYDKILTSENKKIISDSIKASISEGNENAVIDTDQIISRFEDKLSSEEYKKFDKDKAEDFLLEYLSNEEKKMKPTSWEKSNKYNTKEHTIYHSKDYNGKGFHEEHRISVGRMGKSEEFYMSVTKGDKEVLNKEFKSFEDADAYAKKYMKENKNESTNTTKKSINTNLKKLEGDKMEEEQKLFSKPEEEVNEIVETETTETEEVKENVELKSAIVSLKSEIEKINTDNLALKTELKAVAERLEKIETQPIKKSLAADKSKMLGVTETSNLREISALDLI